MVSTCFDDPSLLRAALSFFIVLGCLEMAHEISKLFGQT